MRDDCLIQLLKAPFPLTLREIASRLNADFNDVRRAMNGLLTEGLVYMDDGMPVRGTMTPTWVLTHGGERAAHTARVAARNAKLRGTEKPSEVQG